MVVTRKAILSILPILALAAALRLIGITWGLPSDERRHSPFHPDERWAMANLRKTRFMRRHLISMAYREGPLTNYVWRAATSTLHVFGLLDEPSTAAGAYSSAYARVLLASRLVTIVFDLMSVVLVFCIVLRITGEVRTSLFAASLLAITPFEAIYAHYMRAHVPANFWYLLAVYFSLPIGRRRNWRDYLLSGALTGLALSARYTSVVVVCIPVMLHVARKWRSRAGGEGVAAAGKDLLRILVAPHLLLCALLAAATFLATSPGFVLDYGEAYRHVKVQLGFAQTTEVRDFVNFLDLSGLWQLLTYVIPYSTLPALWLLFYVLTPLSLLPSDRARFTLPMFFVGLLYLYCVSKGYYPGVARSVIFLFPIFAILSAVGASEVCRRLRALGTRMPLVRWGGVGAAAAIMLSSGFYALAYVKAMAEPDPRERLREDLARRARSEKIVAVRCTSLDQRLMGFAAAPVLHPWKEVAVSPVLVSRVPDAELDYLIVGDYERKYYDQTEAYVRMLVARGGFSLAGKFENRIELFGLAFEYSKMPHDMQYPFPRLFLLKRDRTPVE